MRLTVEQLRTIITKEMNRIDEVMELWWVQNEWPEAIPDLIDQIGTDIDFDTEQDVIEYIENNVDFDTRENPEGAGPFDVYLTAMDRQTGMRYRYDDHDGVWSYIESPSGPPTMYSPQTPRGANVPENKR